jgi:hypothetical protein
VPAGGAGRIDADLQAGICNLRLKNCLGHRRTADIAQAQNKD